MNIAIVIEYDASEERFYLSFRRLKFRGDDSTSIDYFLQPFCGKNTKIQLQDDIATGPVYRLSLLDEIGAQIKEDADAIQDITRREMNFLAPLSDDPDDLASAEFIGTMFDDIDRSGVMQENMLRDEEGFIILVPKLNMSSLSGVHMMS